MWSWSWSWAEAGTCKPEGGEILLIPPSKLLPASIQNREAVLSTSAAKIIDWTFSRSALFYGKHQPTHKLHHQYSPPPSLRLQVDVLVSQTTIPTTTKKTFINIFNTSETFIHFLAPRRTVQLLEAVVFCLICLRLLDVYGASTQMKFPTGKNKVLLTRPPPEMKRPRNATRLILQFGIVN